MYLQRKSVYKGDNRIAKNYMSLMGSIEKSLNGNSALKLQQAILSQYLKTSLVDGLTEQMKIMEENFLHIILKQWATTKKQL